ncbi:hypothetical protein SCHPADRAFT_897137 [Schizopora paradoxa]|uniref:Uncharacterized protein n=1 Tax=Schizopora paradoxa TaxID=27342 RepID=A0A0H2QY48_9AGAM|nr:hypothetical protein SCHPADRAFT_897137 [Schizopora paradoxa]
MRRRGTDERRRRRSDDSRRRGRALKILINLDPSPAEPKPSGSNDLHRRHARNLSYSTTNTAVAQLTILRGPGYSMFVEEETRRGHVRHGRLTNAERRDRKEKDLTRMRFMMIEGVEGRIRQATAANRASDEPRTNDGHGNDRDTEEIIGVNATRTTTEGGRSTTDTSDAAQSQFERSAG